MIDRIIDLLPVFLNVILCTLSFLFLLDTFKSKRQRPLICFLAVILGNAVLSAALIFIDKGIFKTLAFFLFGFICSFFYKQRLYVRLLLSAVFISLLSVSDVTSLLIVCALFKLTPEATLSEPFSTLGILFMFTVVMLILVILRHTKKFIATGSFDKRLILFYSLPISATFVIFMDYSVLRAYNVTASIKLNMLIGALLLIVTSYIVFYLYDALFQQLENEKRLKEARLMIEKQAAEYKKLIKTDDEIKLYRHDIKGFIMGILYTLENGSIDEAKAALTKKLDTFNEYSRLIQSESVIGTVLKFKADEAKDSNITVNYKIKHIRDHAFDDIDLSILTGNLIDNAIEACLKLKPEAKKCIDVFFEYSPNGLCIYMANPVAEGVNVLDLKTSKKDKRDHGLGLISVESLVEKYNGSIVFNLEDNVFEVYATLYDT